MKRLKVRFTNELLADLLKVKDNIKLINSRSDSFNNTTELLFESDRFEDVKEGCETPATELERVLDSPFKRYGQVIKTDLSYGEAMIALNDGDVVTRAVWYGFWKLEVIKGLSNPIIVATCKDGSRVPATPYQEDMCATDWMIVTPLERNLEVEETLLAFKRETNVTDKMAADIAQPARTFLVKEFSGIVEKKTIDKYFMSFDYNPRWFIYLVARDIIKIYPFAEGQMPCAMLTPKGEAFLDKIRELNLY